MRVLLDENLPRKLKNSILLEAETGPECGWSGVKNGHLLRLAASEYDVLLTMDRGMQFQQNLKGIDLCVIVISAPSNDIDDLLPLVPKLNAAIKEGIPGQIVRLAI